MLAAVAFAVVIPILLPLGSAPVTVTVSVMTKL
jgi:hypothetical protein